VIKPGGGERGLGGGGGGCTPLPPRSIIGNCQCSPGTRADFV